MKLKSVEFGREQWNKNISGNFKWEELNIFLYLIISTSWCFLTSVHTQKHVMKVYWYEKLSS